jgi:Putative addiction module component
MNARTRKVLEEALELPSAERGELARELLESLQDTAAPDVESAWAAVIARRAQEVLDGTAATRDLDEGLAEIEVRARARAAPR